MKRPTSNVTVFFFALMLIIQRASTFAAGPGPQPMTTPATQVPSYLSYVYEGDRYRDPFISLGGDRGANNAHPPQINALVLKGLVKDKASRVALLSSGVSSYILRAGRLYDGRNRPIKGITGVIKTQTVVLVGPDRTIREIRAEHLQ